MLGRDTPAFIFLILKIFQYQKVAIVFAEIFWFQLIWY